MKLVSARIMLTVNVDMQDGLVNGQLETVKHISIDMTSNIKNIYAKLDDWKLGLKKMNSHNFGKQYSWVKIEKSEVDIRY